MQFQNERNAQANLNWFSSEVRREAKNWHDFSRKVKYQYMFDWCGLPVIQDPQDICLIHELLWSYQPTVVIETGVARGGSLMLSASVLAAQNWANSNSSASSPPQRVIGIDIDIRPHNRRAIEKHPLAPLITLIEGSSTDPEVVAKVSTLVPKDARVALILDSNHTRDHVFSELSLYTPLLRVGSPVLVMDTGIEFADTSSFSESRPWGPGNSPYTAVQDFLATSEGMSFEIDSSYERQQLITAAPGGLLRKGTKATTGNDRSP